MERHAVSSRKNSPNAIERLVKRRLGRHNYDLLKPQRTTPKILEHGGYKVRDAATGKIVFGEAGYEFSADLDDVEHWLDRIEAE
jgi:hypothetical protein